MDKKRLLSEDEKNELNSEWSVRLNGLHHDIEDLWNEVEASSVIYKMTTALEEAATPEVVVDLSVAHVVKAIGLTVRLLERCSVLELDQLTRLELHELTQLFFDEVKNFRFVVNARWLTHQALIYWNKGKTFERKES